jgi:Fe-Mn family superoxide dismutase
MDRRKFLMNSSKAGLGTLVLTGGIAGLESCGSSKKSGGSGVYPGAPGFTQASLGYDYNALEPAIDARTMEIHFTRHAATYTKNMSDAIAAENVSVANL